MNFFVCTIIISHEMQYCIYVTDFNCSMGLVARVACIVLFARVALVCSGAALYLNIISVPDIWVIVHSCWLFYFLNADIFFTFLSHITVNV